MPIRTNSVSYFRTTYTGSDSPGTGSGWNYLHVMGVGNEMSTPSSSQIVHLSEHTRSCIDYSMLTYFRDAATPAVTPNVRRFWFTLNDNKNFLPQISNVNSVNFQTYVLSPGQSGDPYSIVYASVDDHRPAALIMGYKHTINQSASFDTLYWIYGADGARLFGGTATAVSNRAYTTYTYNSETTIRNTKTVQIPINSFVGSQICGPTMQVLDRIGAIPALDTFLPEASKSIIDIVVEFYSFTALNSATNFQLLYNIDSGTTYSGSLYYGVANGGVYGYDTWRLYTSSLDTSTSHSIYVGSTLSNTFSQLGAIVNVTYTYDVAATTRSLNSVIISPLLPDSGDTMLTNAGLDSVVYEYLLPEPGPIELKQSGFLLFTSCAATQTVNFKCGAQPFVSYRLLQASVNSGMYPIIHRIDSLSTGSTAFTLQHGYNYISSSWYANTANVVGGLSGMLIMNYESNVSNLGIGAHTHTLFLTMTASAAGTSVDFEWPTYGPVIPETNYYISDAIPVIYRYNNSTSEISELYMYYTGSEMLTKGEGYVTTGTSVRTDGEYGVRIGTLNIGEFIRRYPQYPDVDKMDILTRREYKFRNTNASSAHSAEFLLTYNSIYFNITGSILNYTGDGAMPIRVLDIIRNKVILVSSSSVGGNISNIWYDDVNNLQIIAFNSSSYAVSDIKPAGSGSYTINFASSSVSILGGEHSYTFLG